MGDGGSSGRWLGLSRRERAFVVVGALILAIVVLFSVYQGQLGPRPYTSVTGPLPSYTMGIPTAPVNASLVQAVQDGWVTGPDAYPPETVFRLLSRQFWVGGAQFQDVFFMPVTWPSRLNLTANNLSLDPSGEHLIVPFEVRLQISGGELWVYTILRGLMQNPYDDACNCTENHVSPYGLGMLVREQQYQITWFNYLQSYHNTVLGYNPALPDAYSSPIFTNGSGLVPLEVDGQVVYATASTGLSELPIPPTTDFAAGQEPLNPASAHGLSVVLANSTRFLFDVPLSLLPHTATSLLFDAMFVLEVWPPMGVSASVLAVDYKPGSAVVRDVPSGPDGWNNTAAYLPFTALLPA